MMMHAFWFRLGLIALGGALFGYGMAAETFRWVDEDGVVHYSDQFPPDQAKHRRIKLSPQGRELGIIEGAKSPDQLRREQQLKQLRTEQDRILAEQRDRDLSLLRTYRNQDEMYLALKGKLDMLDTSVKITEANRERQQEMLTGQEKHAAELERSGQAVSKSLRDLIDATRRQVAIYDEKIRNLEKDKKAVTDRFAKDIARFEVIQSQRSNLGERSALSLSNAVEKTGKSEIIISAIACAVGAVCDRAWELAREYVLKHTSAPLSLETERILQTPMLVNDTEFGLTVTRIAGGAEDILFLDVRCRPSTVGEELCSGPRIREIRAGFKAYIESGLAAAGNGVPLRQYNR